MTNLMINSPVTAIAQRAYAIAAVFMGSVAALNTLIMLSRPAAQFFVAALPNMMRTMGYFVRDFKIFDSVVRLIAILVMNDLRRIQWPSDELLHHNTMLSSVSAVFVINLYVTVIVNAPPALPLILAKAASMRAKVTIPTLHAVEPRHKRLMTAFTYSFDLFPCHEVAPSKLSVTPNYNMSD